MLRIYITFFQVYNELMTVKTALIIVLKFLLFNLTTNTYRIISQFMNYYIMNHRIILILVIEFQQNKLTCCY